jgi:hypothetical protein
MMPWQGIAEPQAYPENSCRKQSLRGEPTPSPPGHDWIPFHFVQRTFGRILPPGPLHAENQTKNPALEKRQGWGRMRRRGVSPPRAGGLDVVQFNSVDHFTTATENSNFISSFTLTVPPAIFTGVIPNWVCFRTVAPPYIPSLRVTSTETGWVWPCNSRFP